MLLVIIMYGNKKKEPFKGSFFASIHKLTIVKRDDKLKETFMLMNRLDS